MDKSRENNKHLRQLVTGDQTHNTRPLSDKRSDEHWQVITLRQELSELKREQEHLRIKSAERKLTNWEISRMESLLDEVLELMKQFAAAGVSVDEKRKNHDLLH